MTAEEARRKLRKIGARRRRMQREKGTLRSDTEKAMRDALSATPPISISEACRLTGVSRSSVYSEYDL